jgi:hypothetical protein
LLQFVHRRCAFINEVFGQNPNIDVRGREQLNEFHPHLTRGMALPCIHNHIIEINGDNAKGTCSIEVRITQKNQSIIGSGYYADTTDACSPSGTPISTVSCRC